jgi:ABC-type nitrate/sulfonate/bicarbonate transport system ATPase subunit
METNMVLELEKVSFNYSKMNKQNADLLQLLSNINLKISAGEIVSICGKNGSGKSTILNLVAGFINPLSGKITRAKSEEEVFGAMVFQEIGLLDWKNCFANVELGIISKNLTEEENEKIVLENLALLGLTESKNKFPKELSGGLKQRVALARALASSPKVLLLDEPFSALDWNVKEKLIKDLRKILKAKQISAIFVTHNPDDAFLFSDRVLALNEGCLVHVVSNLEKKHTKKFLESGEFAKARTKLIKSIL